MSENGSLDEKRDFKPKHKDTCGSRSTGDTIITIDSPTTAVDVASGDDSSSVSPSTATPMTPGKYIKTTITKPLEKFKTGYPRLAAFQSSDPAFSLYRGFSYLHSRVLLELQDELRVLEENLNELDEDLELEDPKRLQSRTFDDYCSKKDPSKPKEFPSQRARLISTIRGKLVDYDEVLVKARELNAFQRPSNRDYRSVRWEFWNQKPLSDTKEERYIKQREDIVTLRLGREWAGFDGLIENLVRKMHCRLIHKIFSTPELRAKTSDKSIHYYSTSRISKLVGFLITIIIFVLLICPVVAMYNLTSIGKRDNTFDAIGVLVVFTLLFSAAMSLLTKAQRHELFAASAAYAAVLVVFISNFNGSSPGNGTIAMSAG